MDENQLCNMIKEVKDWDFVIALDDMRVEQSTLKMLSIPGIEVVKFDRSVIAKITTEERLVKLVRNLIVLCHDLGQKCVAEGIETIEQYNIMENLNCDYIQGYLIEKAISPAQFESRYLY